MELEQGQRESSYGKSDFFEDGELFKTCFGEVYPPKTKSNCLHDWNFEIFEQPGLKQKYNLDQDPFENQQTNFDQYSQNQNIQKCKSQLKSSSYIMIGSIHSLMKDSIRKSNNRMSYSQPLLVREEFNIVIDDKVNEIAENKQRRRTIVANIETNRLLKLKGQNELNKKLKPEWTWDTSAALIRLMLRNRKIRFFTNIYIWILLGLRVFYIIIILNFFLKNVTALQSYTYFWTAFIVFVCLRLTFMLIVLKIFTQGYKINDQKIKIVYETYMQILDQYKKQLDDQKENQVQKIRMIRVRMIMRQFWIILTPPEFSFIFVTINEKMQSGFYQVQNFIMKSLEMFFFVPFLIYFLKTKVSKDDFQTQFDLFNWFYIAEILLYSDIILFIVFVAYLLLNNQRKSSVTIEQGYI